jgi:MFS family permease
VLQSIGELLIMPIGYAMIGKLAPKQYQGVMMGTWMFVTGLASLFAGDFSGMILEPTGTTAIATNAGYAKLFAELGVGSLAVGNALVVLIPFLRKLITDKGRDAYRGNTGYRRSRRLNEALHHLRLESRTFVRLPLHRLNGANGMSDIEGKVTRVGASERGQRTSFKIGCRNFCKGLFLKAAWRWFDRNTGMERMG